MIALEVSVQVASQGDVSSSLIFLFLKLNINGKKGCKDCCS